MIFIGIDPGKKGGICLIPSEARTSGARTWKMPETASDLWHLIASFETDIDTFVLLEEVHAGTYGKGGKMGVSSAFNFGKNYGHLEMALIAARLPFQRITPSKWQKEFGLTRKNKEETVTQKKNRHKARAQELCPAIKMTHAIADAFLIAEFCRRMKGGTS